MNGKENRCKNTIISVIDSSVTYYALNKCDSNLLVHEYIRSLLSSIPVNKLNVPDEIITLLFLFYYESMPSSLISGLGRINYDKSEINREFSEAKERTYWISQVGWITGRHSLKVQMDKLPNGSLAIGLVTNPKGFVELKASKLPQNEFMHEMDLAFESERSGVTYQMYFNNEGGHSDSHFVGMYEYNEGQPTISMSVIVEWKSNDTIGLIIDCNKWTLSFYVNDQVIGFFPSIIPLQQNSRYHPAIAVGGNVAVKLQIVECE